MPHRQTRLPSTAYSPQQERCSLWERLNGVVVVTKDKKHILVTQVNLITLGRKQRKAKKKTRNLTARSTGVERQRERERERRGHGPHFHMEGASQVMCRQGSAP